MKKTAIALASLACLIAGPVTAQTRATTQTPPARNFQPAQPDPVITRLNALQQELDALKETAGKQVVVLHFSPTEHPGTLTNTASTNQERATDFCEQILGDRFGRMINYRIWTNGDRFFLTHIACETKL